MLAQANALAPFPLADGSVHMCVTSPAYFGLRDYGIAGQLGMEASLDEYVSNLVQVFREVWRVMRPDGTLWLNLGDSYANPGNNRNGEGEARNLRTAKFHGGTSHLEQRRTVGDFGNLKPKDLIGIPWRVAFALQADGWYLRSEITWAKKAPMPESVTDRPTSATEKVFLLSKQPTYYYDADAVREEKAQSTAKDPRSNGNGHRRDRDYPGAPSNGGTNLGGAHGGRNMRNWWLLGPEPYPLAHFATFPTEVPRRAILAGTSAAGVCPVCGAPWERVTETERAYHHVTTSAGKSKDGPYASQTGNGAGSHDIRHGVYSNSKTTGWVPTCAHARADTVPAVVLDCFCGSGTTGAVAKLHGRRFVGLDLNAKYLSELALPRAEGRSTAASIASLPLFAQVQP